METPPVFCLHPATLELGHSPGIWETPDRHMGIPKPVLSKWLLKHKIRAVDEEQPVYKTQAHQTAEMDMMLCVEDGRVL